MSRNKKLVLVLGAALVMGLVALVVLPPLFVGTVEERVRAEIERATRVRVTWSDIGLGLLGDFPNARLTLSGLDVVGTGSFEGDTLASVADFRLELGLGSVLRSIRGTGPLEVRSVTIQEPAVRLRVDEDGVASWDVMIEGQEAEEDVSGRGLAVSLRSFEIADGSFLFQDASSDLFVALDGVRHSLEGDFSREALVARTTARADAVTLRFAGTPYLGGVSLDFQGSFDVDMVSGEARLVENELRLNELAVRFDGVLAREDEHVALDLSFAAPSTGFSQVLSLVPVVYGQDFASLETSGAFSLEGRVGGAMGPGTFPSFALDLDVTDGRFRYPDLPLPAEAIAAELAITNPGGDIDSTVVDLSAFHVEIGEQSLDAAFMLRTPVSDPAIDARVEGALDLGDLARTVKLADVEELEGTITADASMTARRSDVDEGRFDRIAAEGTLAARDVRLRGEALRQPVDVRETEIRLTPETAELRSFDAQLGSSDIQATGRLDNLLGFAFGDQPLRGAATLTSERLILDEWRSERRRSSIPVPSKLDLTVDANIDELVVNGLETRNARGRAMVGGERLTLEGFGLETLGGRVAMDGFYETVVPEAPAFALDLELDSLDVAGASEQFLTVEALAPVARYARGTFSSSLSLTGVLGQDLSPVLDVLDGDGSLATSRLVIEGFPLLERLGDRLGLQRLSNPVVQAVRSSIRIQDGRLAVEPFDVSVGDIPMTVSGSSGIDRSLDYRLSFQVPRAGLADDVLTSLSSSLGPLGSELSELESVPLAVRVTGTVTQPSLDLGLRETGGSLREAAARSATAPVEERVEEVRTEVDSARAEARRRAQARADSVLADARRQAEAIRDEAARTAERVREEGDRAAEEILARATNPIARAAAEPAAERVRSEAQERAEAIEREADQRATALVEAAEARAASILARDTLPSGGGG